MGVALVFLLVGVGSRVINIPPFAIAAGICGVFACMIAIVYLLIENFSPSKTEIK